MLEKGKLYSLNPIKPTPWNYCFLFNSELSTKAYGGITGVLHFNKDIFVLLEYKKNRKYTIVKLLQTNGKIGYLEVDERIFEFKKES